MDRQQQIHYPYSSACPIMPTQRNLHFNVPAEQVATWNKNGMYISHFLNSLSIFYPVGERFFIYSVRTNPATVGVRICERNCNEMRKKRVHRTHTADPVYSAQNRGQIRG